VWDNVYVMCVVCDFELILALKTKKNWLLKVTKQGRDDRVSGVSESMEAFLLSDTE
jgi:hypothetical protein